MFLTDIIWEVAAPPLRGDQEGVRIDGRESELGMEAVSWTVAQSYFNVGRETSIKKCLDRCVHVCSQIICSPLPVFFLLWKSHKAKWRENDTR